MVEPEGVLRQLPSETGESLLGVGVEWVGLNLVLRDGEKFSATEAVEIGTSDEESDNVNKVQVIQVGTRRMSTQGQQQSQGSEAQSPSAPAPGVVA